MIILIRKDSGLVQQFLRKAIFFVLIVSSLFVRLNAQQIADLKVITGAQPDAFPLLQNHKIPPILTDTKDAEVVGIAANAIVLDFEKIGGVKAKVIHSMGSNNEYLIIAGTVGRSIFIDQLVKSKKLDISSIQNKWESYSLTTVKEPFKGVKQALVIAGSDRRGTAYGLFELSRKAGVSPWVWWADVTPEAKKSLYVLPGLFTQKEPTVKYRGIFINDEDWGLNAWAKRNMDTNVKDMGPNTYTKVFELMLRLKANVIWPAMHDSTKAFWYYRDNPKIADKYAIVIGSTHCDMMLRSNTFEWQKSFKEEYGVEPGPYRYDTNKAQIYKYWEDRVIAAKDYEAMYTVGMRGVRDGTIVGPTTKEGKISLTETIIQDQRGIFARHFGGPTKALQIFCPYKEVLTLYQGGLKVPDDVTLIWTDDNFGYIRQLSNPAEQQRSGASGIYYHLSYLGGPHDYLWLSTNSPSLVAYEMDKAYQFGANRFWVVNVGDIKPAENEIQFFMDMAWDIKKWNSTNAHLYPKYWAEQTFGTEFGAKIADIKKSYYQLAQSGKPEHIGILQFDRSTMQQRLNAYADLVKKVDQVKETIPSRLKNAFFELVEYPVKGAALMNQKIFNAKMSLDLPVGNSKLATEYSQKAKNAFDQIKALTDHYNNGIENGKWNGIISYAPRNLSVYGMPKVADSTVLGAELRTPKIYDRRYLDTTRVNVDFSRNLISLKADSYKTKHQLADEKISTFTGLGSGGTSISRYPFTGLSFKQEEYQKAPYVEYTLDLKPGKYQLSLKCLPNKAIYKGRGLGMAVSINKQVPAFVNVDNPKEDKKWSANLLRGYAEDIVPLTVERDGLQTVRVYLLDTGLALNRIDVIPN